MKNYQKAEMIAKNLPTGSYAAGCPAHTHHVSCDHAEIPMWANDPRGAGGPYPCSYCEIAQ